LAASHPPELIQSVQAQADLRLRFGLVMLVIVLVAISFWGPTHPDTNILEIAAFALAYVTYMLAALYASRRHDVVPPHALVIATAILDPLVVTVWLYIAGESSLLIVGFYLFTILGFGFRIGARAMHVCQAVSILGLGVVASASPIWRAQPFFALSHIVLLLVVPLYAGSLIRKVQAARDAAERASLAKSQLLAKVSHELRTPLTGIVSTASLIEAQTRETDSSQRARSIVDLALGLDLEIKQLLDLSRIESGRDAHQEIAFDIRQVTDHVATTLAPIAAAKQLGLSSEVDPRISGAVMGDAYALNSILMNLAGNAVKFTPSGSVAIQVALLEQDDDAYRLRFTVQDTGIGIPQSVQQKIFEPFFQVETGPVRRYGGTGLGTSIALAHVRRMGGELQLESAQGEGTRFWFELRMARTVPSPAQATEKAAPVRIVRGKRILVADDNGSNLRLIAEMLERDDHVVTPVESGADALEALATADFDAVFLDFNMQDMDGASVYEAYRFGRIQTAPTWFVTADTSSLTAKRLEALGAAGVIYKPVTFDKLRSAIAAGFPDEGTAAAPTPPRPAQHLRPVPVEYLDPAAIETLREIRDTPEFLCRMIADGVADIERIDQALSGALLACDVAAVHRQAHALRGVSLSVGAVRLAALADKLMTIGQRDLETTSRERHGELRKTADLSLAALDALRQALAASEAANATR
jgi:two-component system sensor histidine kinase RpfC